MKAKRDYRLTIEGKFNMRAIMQLTRAYRVNYRYSKSEALKNAWADARFYKQEKELEAMPVNFPRKSISLYANPKGDMAMGIATR